MEAASTPPVVLLSPPEAMRVLCRARRRWHRRLREILREELFYPEIASLGHDLMKAVLKGDERPARRAFRAIERCLLEGDQDTRNLIIAGMFEPMQNDAYHQCEPPDRMDAWLGPVSQKAWADLIEGWTGKGIRSVEQWRRVILNGLSLKISWEGPENGWTIERQEGGARLDLQAGEAHRSRLLDQEQAAAIFAQFLPLMSLRLLDPGGEAPPLAHGLLRVEQPGASHLIRVGDRLGEGRVASDGRRWFLLDVEAIATVTAGA